MITALTSLSLCLSVLQAAAASGPAYSLADYDGDGLLDVYVVHPGGEDVLFRNLGDGSFLDVTAESGLTGLSGSRDALWQDFDGDGAVDLYVSFRSGSGRLFQNTGVGAFVDASDIAGFAPAGGELDAAWLDYDADLQPDLYVATLEGDRLYRNAGSGRFERVELVPIADGAGTVVLTPATGAEYPPRGTPDGTESSGGERPGAKARQPRRSLDLSGLGGAPRFAQPLSVGVGPSSASQPLVLAPSACATALRDAVAGGCTLLASNTPTLGMLYPMSTALNVSATGNVGIGTTTPDKKLHIDQPSPSGDGIGVLFGPRNGTGPYNQGNQRIAIAAWDGNAGLSLLRHGQLGFLTEVDANGLAFKEGYSGEVGERMRIHLGGNVSIGTATSGSKLTVSGAESTVNGEAAAIRVHNTAAGGGIWMLRAGANGTFTPPGGFSIGDANGYRLVIGSDGNVGIGTSSPTAKLEVAGTTKTNCLTITGGCDLAEPFETVEAAIEPGMVVAIDPEREGRLTLARRAYDRTVVGVVSGANGVKTGMTMSQAGLFEEGAPIALTGRVYCWVDASHGAIQPGDLLTTSDTPGHAMKVMEHDRANGAILGKAMTSLDGGRGLVLIVVALQ